MTNQCWIVIKVKTKNVIITYKKVDVEEWEVLPNEKVGKKKKVAGIDAHGQAQPIDMRLNRITCDTQTQP